MPTAYDFFCYFNQDVQTALQQISPKQYDQRFVQSGKPIVKVGVEFDAKRGNIDDWKME